MKWHSCVLGLLLCPMLSAGAFAIPLSGTTHVDMDSETASAAKNMAVNQARREILKNILGRYANASQLQNALDNAKNDELMNLISSSTIDGEQSSNTAYSANVTMVIDVPVARAWLDEHNVQNWLMNDAVVEDKLTVLITMSDKVANWMTLQQAMRANKLNLGTQYIMGDQVMAEIPLSSRNAFIMAVTNAGWHYMNDNGILRIWR